MFQYFYYMIPLLDTDITSWQNIFGTRIFFISIFRSYMIISYSFYSRSFIFIFKKPWKLLIFFITFIAFIISSITSLAILSLSTILYFSTIFLLFIIQPSLIFNGTRFRQFCLDLSLELRIFNFNYLSYLSYTFLFITESPL